MSQLPESAFTVPHIPGPPLRKLICSKTTKAFLTQHGAWSEDMASAAVFKDYSDAIAAKHQFHLDGETQLYYSFDHPLQSKWDFTMKL